MPSTKRPPDWRKKFVAPKAPHVVMLSNAFAGVPAGASMLISSPGDLANYIARIPAGETRTIDRLRNEMARKAGAQAMCPVTTAIYLKVVAEVALADLAEGKPLDKVIPFWRVITPDSKVARRLSCGPDHVAHLIALDRRDQD
jgi:hypothetical protein